MVEAHLARWLRTVCCEVPVVALVDVARAWQVVGCPSCGHEAGLPSLESFGADGLSWPLLGVGNGR